MEKFEMIVIVTIVVVMVLSFLMNLLSNVMDMRAIRERLKSLPVEEEWHECKEFDWDLPEVDELCVLHIRYRENESEPWEERYVTAEWTGYQWTEDSMNFLRYQKEYKITHWKAVKRVEE